MARVHAFTDDVLADHDAVGLVDLLRSGEVSPQELSAAVAARIETVDPALGGLAHAAYDERPRVTGGFFSGLPMLAKDNVDVAGMPTRHGTDAFPAVPKKADGEWVRALRAVGLNPIGKSRLSEFGFSASCEHPRLGPVRNPWDTDRTAGASSSGSAAFVAAGALPLAHANDGGGSIRIPAASCGLVGLKPTRNRTPQDAMMRHMPVRIVADGVVTRSVRDTAAFLREIELHAPARRLRPIGDVTGPAAERLKVAVVTTSVGREASPEMRELTLKTAALLEGLGHRVEEIDHPVPDSFSDDFLLYWAFLATAIVRTSKLQFGKGADISRYDNLTHGLARHGQRNLPKLPLAIARLARSQRASAALFRQYDVVLTPTVAHETPRIGHLDPGQPFETIIERLMDWVAFTPLQNATGDPSISLPLAQTAAGLPAGMLFSAGSGHEARLLSLAYELEQAQPFARIQD
ncbi:amidase [Nocardioides jejuensis]|uniref:Amidase n=1 Tax=Nocardioides jejuensis TaxID=2502782 RepID=A0A4V2NXL5_9ACTN|nr:amidase [Nocardioides jejuensis]TCJ21722.1 amidase [Nocardioides jejuensis]